MLASASYINIPEYLEKKDSLFQIQYILILDCESADTQKTEAEELQNLEILTYIYILTFLYDVTDFKRPCLVAENIRRAFYSTE
jgi:hypothetical protein